MAFNKWFSALAVVASLGLIAPGYADEMSSDQQETVVPSEEPAADLPADEQETELPSDQQESDMDQQETVLPSDQGQQEGDTDININIDNEADDKAAQEDVVPEEDQGVAEEAVPAPATPQESIIVTQPRAVAQPLDNFLVEIGGGGSTFTSDLGDTLEGGAGWTGRAIIGARSPLGLELGYTGTANAVEGGNLGDADETLFTNGGELLARLNFAGQRSMIKPFIAGGANYTRFTSDTAIDDVDVFAVPLAAGLQFYPMQNFSIGARGEYSILTDLLDEDVPDGDRWGGMLTVGANF